MEHPGPLRLDAARAGEATALERAYLQPCGGCREAVQALQAVAAELRRLGAFPGRVPDFVDRTVLQKPIPRARIGAGIEAV